MFEINKSAFGTFLTERRKEKGYTQKELAAKLFISDKAVSKWERALSMPDISLLIPLAEILDVSVTELLEGRKLDSAAMTATATDSLSDTAATSAVLAATLIAHFTGVAIDGWCGVLVGLFICYAGYSAARDTISPLLGQAPDREFVSQISRIVTAHEEVLGIHDLIVHNYGPGRVLISLHAEVPAEGNFLALHDTIDTIEHELRNVLNCHAVIHMDPVCTKDEETSRLKDLVKGYLREISDIISMHDFRIVAGPTHTNLIFDVVTPYDFPMSDGELVKKIQNRIQQDNPDYFAVIEVDKQMV